VSTNQTIKSHATTREYTERYQQTDMAKAELGRYCEGCGRLPCWCECNRKPRDNPNVCALEDCWRPRGAGELCQQCCAGEDVGYQDGA
jgi:hypothetical protein